LGHLVEFFIFTKLKIYNLKPTLQVINLLLNEYNLVLDVEHVQEVIIKKKMKLFINVYLRFFTFMGVNQSLNAYQCTHDKNYHHHMNYINLDYSNFFHLKFSHVVIICKN
jgi:hypothetical protein